MSKKNKLREKRIKNEAVSIKINLWYALVNFTSRKSSVWSVKMVRKWARTRFEKKRKKETQKRVEKKHKTEWKCPFSLTFGTKLSVKDKEIVQCAAWQNKTEQNGTKNDIMPLKNTGNDTDIYIFYTIKLHPSNFSVQSWPLTATAVGAGDHNNTAHKCWPGQTQSWGQRQRYGTRVPVPPGSQNTGQAPAPPSAVSSPPPIGHATVPAHRPVTKAPPGRQQWLCRW